MWTQNYDPVGWWPASTFFAALPILTLMGLLLSNRIAAWKAAAAALAAAMLTATMRFGMPWHMALSAAGMGVVFALIRVVYLIVAAMFLYDIAVKTGRFEVMKASIARLSPDRRVQAVLVAFSFGGFLEGCAGFGAPVAICSAFLVGLGFHPLQAAILGLVADTVCVCWGSVGIPLVTLGAISGMDVQALNVTTAAILVPAALTIPFWLAAIVAGPRGALGVWPTLLTVGGTYAAVQFFWARFVNVELVSIAAAIASLAAGAVALRLWKPANHWRFDGEDAADAAVSETYSAREIVRAWLPFAVLTAIVMIWVAPAVKPRLETLGTFKFEVAPLHLKVARGAAVTGHETPTPTDLEKAVAEVPLLSTVGTAVLLSAILGGLLAGVGPVEQGRVFAGTVKRMAKPAAAILCMLALGYVTRYSGMDAVLGLAFTRTGTALYPAFGTWLGWLGTALTGSITSSNVLFGNLQKITATHLGISPILMGAANTAGGAMGKMIAAASIVVAAAATGETGHEGKVLRGSLPHSLAMGLFTAILVWAVAWFAPLAAIEPEKKGGSGSENVVPRWRWRSVDAEVPQVDPGRPTQDHVGDEFRGGRRELQPRPAMTRGDHQVSEPRREADVRSGVQAAGPEPRPGGLDPGVGQRRAERGGHVQKALERIGRGEHVETGLFLGRPDQDSALVARDEVTLAVLDDPSQHGSAAVDQHDLAFHRGRRRGDAHAFQQVARPRAGGDHDRLGVNFAIGGADARHAVALGGEALDPTVRQDDPAAKAKGFRQRPQVPRVADLGAVGEEVRSAEVGRQGRLDAGDVGRGEPFVGDPLDAPAAGGGPQVALVGLGHGDVDAAGTAIAVVDPSLLAEDGRPLGIKSGAPGPEGERGMRGRPVRVALGGEHPRAGPRGLATGLAAVQHGDGESFARQGEGDGEPNDPAPRDDHVETIGHIPGRLSPQRSFFEIRLPPWRGKTDRGAVR